MKICLISSTGGHLAELKKLIPAVSEHDYFIITEFSEMSRDLDKTEKVYYLSQQERKNKKFAFLFLKNIVKSFYVLLKENPKVIITTGAGAVYPTCLLGKLIGKKIIYIESFAKIFDPSVTGKLVYKIADEFFIQWETLSKHYPNAKYRGSLY